MVKNDLRNSRLKIHFMVEKHYCLSKKYIARQEPVLKESNTSIQGQGSINEK